MTTPEHAPDPVPGQTAPRGAHPARRVRDRDVVVAAAIAVVIVLGAQALGVFVPGFDDLLGLQPVMILVLVLVTVVILIQAVRAGMDRR
jgi:cadmium resistance protein CadD (predicted permease)